jgi:Protein of unknown function (DUF3631)
MMIGRMEEVSSDGKARVIYDADNRAETPSEEGAALLRDAEDFVRRYLVLPPGALLPVALWGMGTHLFSIFDCFPYLAIVSPTKQCGKTRLLEILGLLCSDAERTSNISEAALFRLIEQHHPTLLLDEMEQLREKGERAQILRNLLNAGNRRDAVAIRCADGGARIERCNVFCPKALATIGLLPETITDRAISIQMQRRTHEEKIERFLFQKVEPEARKIRERFAAWAKYHRDTIQAAYADAPDLDFLGDRDAEAWMPLFAILAVADPGRLKELRQSAELLSGQKHEDAGDESLALRALLDAASVLRKGEEFVASAELLTRMRSIDEAPWSGPDFDARRLARFLRPFGIRSKVFRDGDSTPRGYGAAKLSECARRYDAGLCATNATGKERKDLEVSDVADVARNVPFSQQAGQCG